MKEQSFTPATGSPLSERSLGVWIDRRPALAPQSVQLSEPGLEGFKISWTLAAMQDCIFSAVKLEVSINQEPQAPYDRRIGREPFLARPGKSHKDVASLGMLQPPAASRQAVILSREVDHL